MTDLQQLGKYKIVEVIGEGALGTVYKGMDPAPERPVALKTFRKERLGRDLSGQIVARFKNQVLAAGRLAHPGIVDTYDYGEDDRIAYVATEYLQGRGLSEFLALRLRLGLDDILSIMTQLLEALDFAHENGVIHQDVKPANIIMMLSGRLKVSDFWIERLDSSLAQQAGTLMGTPAYMSPEQYSGLKVDRRSDIFSCGVVLYELLTGSKPFEGSERTVGYRICNEAHRNASELNPAGVPPTIDAVISRALAKKAEERYPTAREFSGALASSFKSGGEGPASAEAGDQATRAMPKERPDAGFRPPVWEAEQLRALEELLVFQVGPLAKMLIKQSARTAADGPALVGLLAKYIPTEAKKREFIAAALDKVAASARSEAAAQQATVHLSKNLIDPGEIDKAASRLAPYLGPIARVLAKKTPGRTSDLKAYYRHLAENLDPKDRARFLKDAGYEP
ncbi:MAG TPA: serine/threonine-protein kinase [Burkholderiales bacterium]|nr:serine/threonine-protein kinase [Burkholderiales bacterium]